MTNIDRAAEVLWLPEPHLSTSECDDQARELAQALADAGLLTPEPQIIRTVKELLALDPETVLQRGSSDPWFILAVDLRIMIHKYGSNKYLPAVVVATADQVRAAREALEEA